MPISTADLIKKCLYKASNTAITQAIHEIEKDNWQFLADNNNGIEMEYYQDCDKCNGQIYLNLFVDKDGSIVVSRSHWLTGKQTYITYKVLW